VGKQIKYNTSSIIPWEIKVSSPAVFFFWSENLCFFYLNIGLANHKGFFNSQKYKTIAKKFVKKVSMLSPCK
jgi:hypothetical protein